MNKDGVRYTVRVNNRWFPDMLDDADTSGSSENYAGIFGHEITGVVIDGVDKYSLWTVKSGLLEPVYKYDKSDSNTGDGSPIIGIKIMDPSVKYRVHIKGEGWSDTVYGYNLVGCGDPFKPIDAIQIIRITECEER